MDGTAIGVNYTQDFTIEVKFPDNPQIKLSVFPNPTTGELIIKNENLNIGFKTVAIYNIYGTLLSSFTPVYNEIQGKEGFIKINISHLQSGIYIVYVMTEKGIVVPAKVVKLGR